MDLKTRRRRSCKDRFVGKGGWSLTRLMGIVKERMMILLKKIRTIGLILLTFFTMVSVRPFIQHLMTVMVRPIPVIVFQVSFLSEGSCFSLGISFSFISNSQLSPSSGFLSFILEYTGCTVSISSVSCKPSPQVLLTEADCVNKIQINFFCKINFQTD